MWFLPDTVIFVQEWDFTPTDSEVNLLPGETVEGGTVVRVASRKKRREVLNAIHQHVQAQIIMYNHNVHSY